MKKHTYSSQNFKIYFTRCAVSAGLVVLLFLGSALQSFSVTVTIKCTGTSGSYNSGTVTESGVKSDGNLTTLKGRDLLIGTGSYTKGFARFDLSSIPVGAVVTAVSATFFVYSSTSSVTSNNLFGFLGDPAALSGSALYAAIPTSPTFNKSTWPPSSSNTKVLTAAGISFINANVGGFVNIAYVREDVNTFDIYGYPGSTANQPALVITYTACPIAAVTSSGAGTFCGQATITATGGTGGTIYFQGTTSNGISTATPSTTQVVTSSGTYYFRSYDGSCWGVEGAVTVTITPGPCLKWLNQYCPTLPTGSYIDGGTIAPDVSLQTISTATNTGSYGYVFWSFVASKDSTYYFDLCSSTGTAGDSWLRLHDARNTSPSNNYCMNSGNTPTLVLENRMNGCIGTGVGLSKLIWTCQASGTYYLESASGVNPSFWGVAGNQTATLNYKTLPSYSITCAETFYDKGIDGTNGATESYNNNENWIYTYYPMDTVADAINVQFLSFSTSAGDLLCVYNGNSINAPLLGCFGGPSITGAFMSTANDGSLTFQFTSSDSVISTGWEATVSCVPSLKVPSIENNNSISIYPNPVGDRLEIKHLSLAISGIQIFNAIGANVYSQTANLLPSSSSIDVRNLAPGIYFIQVENGNGKWNGRFMKQ